MASRAGMSNATVPAYQSEIVPASNRGRFVGSHGVFLVLGYVNINFNNDVLLTIY